MPFHCCYGVCKSDSRKPEDGVTFMPFPKPNKYLQIAKRWVYLCARDNFTIKKITRYTYICSKHFPVGEVLNIKANPTLEPYNACKPYCSIYPKSQLMAVQYYSVFHQNLGFSHMPSWAIAIGPTWLQCMRPLSGL